MHARTTFLLISILVAGCGGRARVVLRDAAGGVLALEGRQDKARRSAQQMIEAHCGTAGYSVLAEEEVPVGSRVTIQGQSRGTSEGVLTDDGVAVDSQRRTTGVVQSSTVNELRISYRCGAVPVMVAAPPPAVSAVSAVPASPGSEPPIVDPGPARAVGPGPAPAVGPAQTSVQVRVSP